MDSDHPKRLRLLRHRLTALGKPVALRLNQVAIWLETTPGEALGLPEAIGIAKRTGNAWEITSQ